MVKMANENVVETSQLPTTAVMKGILKAIVKEIIENIKVEMFPVVKNVGKDKVVLVLPPVTTMENVEENGLGLDLRADADPTAEATIANVDILALNDTLDDTADQ